MNNKEFICSGCGKPMYCPMPDKIAKNITKCYCKECTKQQQYLSHINKQYKIDDKLIIELLKTKNIPITGLDKDKVIHTRIKMYDLPNMFESIWKSLPPFLIKYHWSYEEYKFFVTQCEKNKFYII